MNIYESLKNRSNEYKKVIGRNAYTVRQGEVSVHDLHLEPVDSRINRGNPRFWGEHQKMLSENPHHGPMTEEEQIAYLLNTGDDKTKKEFELLKKGLELSKESHDDIHVLYNGEVAEGNRRVCASRIINKENPDLLKTVRVVCYPSGVKKEDIITAMGFRHIARPSRWESGNQAEALSVLCQSGMSEHDIGMRLGMPARRVKQVLEGGNFLKKYQKQSGDYRPDRFSLFYKLACNTKLKKVLVPAKDGKNDDKYDPEMWDRFCQWVKNDKINDARSDIGAFTSQDIGLLRYPSMLAVIDKEGTTAAINQIRLAKGKKDKHPGIKNLKQAISDINKMLPTESEKLFSDKSYTEELGKLQSQLNQAIEKFTLHPLCR